MVDCIDCGTLLQLEQRGKTVTVRHVVCGMSSTSRCMGYIGPLPLMTTTRRSDGAATEKPWAPSVHSGTV